MRIWRVCSIVLVLVCLPLAANAGKLDHWLTDRLGANPAAVPVIVMTHGNPAPASARAEILGARVSWVYDLIDGFAATLPSVSVAALAGDPDVASVHLDREVGPLLDVSHRAIEADRAWSSSPSVTGAGITVAVIDTGIDQLHPFFSGAIVRCASTIGGLITPECTDSDGHGSHVAGIIASRDDEYPGVAPGAKLAIVRVLHAGGTGLSSDIIAGMNWVKNNRNKVSPPIRVANMSIGFLNPGCGTGTDPQAEAANNLVSSGVVFTVAAGNEGHGACTIDGASAAPQVITVAAVDDRNTVAQGNDTIASFSSGGPYGAFKKPDVSFPGVSIWSAYLTPLVASLSGTSMAAPHAAGTAALLRERYPQWTTGEVKARIRSTALQTSNTGSVPNRVYGYGLGNACRALGSACN